MLDNSAKICRFLMGGKFAPPPYKNRGYKKLYKNRVKKGECRTIQYAGENKI